MNKITLTLNEIIRLVFTGYVFYGIVQYVGIDLIRKVYCYYGNYGQHIVIFATGVFIYFIYRTVLYPHLEWVEDQINEESIRNYIRKQYDGIGRCKANALGWREASDLSILTVEQEWSIDPHKTWSASIHMQHITGALLILGGALFVIGWIIGSITCLDTIGSFVLVVCGGIFFLSTGGYSDIQFERRKYRNIAILNRDVFNRKIRDYVERIPDSTVTGPSAKKARISIASNIGIIIGMLIVLFLEFWLFVVQCAFANIEYYTALRFRIHLDLLGLSLAIGLMVTYIIILFLYRSISGSATPDSPKNSKG